MAQREPPQSLADILTLDSPDVPCAGKATLGVLAVPRIEVTRDLTEIFVWARHAGSRVGAIGRPRIGQLDRLVHAEVEQLRRPPPPRGKHRWAPTAHPPNP